MYALSYAEVFHWVEEGQLVKKASSVDRQGLARDAVRTAESHHLFGNIVFIGSALEQGAHSGLLLVGRIEVRRGTGTFQVAWSDAVDQDIGGESYSHTPGQMNEPGFRHSIGDGRPRGAETSNRRDVHDAPSALTLHDGRHRFDTQHGSREVHVEDLLPLLIRQCLEIIEGDPLVVRRVIDQNVQAAKHVEHLRHQLVHLLWIGDVTCHSLGAHPCLLELTGDGSRCLATLRIDHYYVTPRLGQRVANALAKTTIPTRNNGYGILELHRSSPQSWQRSARGVGNVRGSQRLSMV